MQVSACLLQLLTKNVHLPSGKNRQCDIMKKRNIVLFIHIQKIVKFCKQ